MKKYCCVLLLLLNTFVLFAENENELDAPESSVAAPARKSILSTNIDFMIIALKNWGYGIGVNYERALTNYLSVKPGLGHMVCFADIPVVSVSVELFFYFYPLSNGLDKLYIGLGSSCDFLMYQQDGMSKDSAIAIMPIVGWKWKVFKHSTLEPFAGWKQYLMQRDKYESIQQYLNGGFRWGVNFYW